MGDICTCGKAHTDGMYEVQGYGSSRGRFLESLPTSALYKLHVMTIPSEYDRGRPTEIFDSAIDLWRILSEFNLLSNEEIITIKRGNNEFYIRLTSAGVYVSREPFVTGFNFVAIIGPDEAAQNKVNIKDLSDRSQQTLTLQEAVSQLT